MRINWLIARTSSFFRSRRPGKGRFRLLGMYYLSPLLKLCWCCPWTCHGSALQFFSS